MNTNARGEKGRPGTCRIYLCAHTYMCRQGRVNEIKEQ